MGRAQEKPLPAAANAAQGAVLTAPQVEFSSTTFDFGRVKQGERVKHAFRFTNAGDTPLEITEVIPGCGCTTAATWDRRVEAGRTGSIPLELNTSSFDGPVKKTITVKTNDPRQGTIELHLEGVVWTPFEIVPKTTVFAVTTESTAPELRIVRIISHLDDPVTLTSVEGATATFHAELKTVKPGREFELRITAEPPFASPTVPAALTIGTSSPEVPAIHVTAQLVVRSPIVVSPSRLLLPGGRIPAGISEVITVRNFGSTLLTLSDVSLNVPGAETSVLEVQPHRYFRIIVTFPAGKELKPSGDLELLIKTNHPQFPLVHVPIAAVPNPTFRARNSGSGAPPPPVSVKDAGP